MFIKETRNRVNFDSPEMFDTMNGPLHDQVHIDYDFKDKDVSYFFHVLYLAI